MRDQMLIGGAWRDGSDGSRISVVDPSTGEEITTVAAGTPADATAAVDMADRAQRGWARVAPRDRAEILRSCWSTLVGHCEELAELITREHGKPLADARAEVAYAAEFFRWNSEEAVRIRGSMSTAPAGANKIIVRHPPVGVVVMVTPWNFPAAMITRKVAPALAAGNAVVIKPGATGGRPAPGGRCPVRSGERRADAAGRPMVRCGKRAPGDTHGVIHRIDAGRSAAPATLR